MAKLSKSHLLSKNIFLLSKYFLESEAKISVLSVPTSFWYLFAMIKLVLIPFISQGFSIVNLIFKQEIGIAMGLILPQLGLIFFQISSNQSISKIYFLLGQGELIIIKKQDNLLTIYMLSMMVMILAIHVKTFALKKCN